MESSIAEFLLWLCACELQPTYQYGRGFPVVADLSFVRWRVTVACESSATMVRVNADVTQNRNVLC